jgi:hypothetical protein
MPLKCGKWTYLFATILAKEKILLDIADFFYMLQTPAKLENKAKKVC